MLHPPWLATPLTLLRPLRRASPSSAKGCPAPRRRRWPLSGSTPSGPGGRRHRSTTSYASRRCTTAHSPPTGPRRPRRPRAGRACTATRARAVTMTGAASASAGARAATSWSKCPPPLGGARGRLPRLLRARLTALAGSALPGERPAHWAPSHCLGCCRLQGRRFPRFWPCRWRHHACRRHGAAHGWRGRRHRQGC